MAAIETRKLRREFGDNVALEGLDLQVPEGAICALIGPNGAGKTTLLRLLAALTAPTSGTASVYGRDILREPREVHARLGFLPDFFGLYEELTAGECLGYFAAAYRLPPDRARERVLEVLRLVGLEGRGGEPVPSLSRGMRQRLGMARTLLHDPPLLLLDEPASGLDPAARQDLQALLKRLSAQGKTIVVSSHILSELEDYCTHVAMLDKGRLVFAGSVEEARRASSGGRRYRLRASAGLEAAPAVVGRRGGRAWRASGDWAEFELDGGPAEAGALLKELLEAGVAVFAFGEAAGTIQDSYLALVGKELR